jgi:hypothetical protein
MIRERTDRYCIFQVMQLKRMEECIPRSSATLRPSKCMRVHAASPFMLYQTYFVCMVYVHSQCGTTRRFGEVSPVRAMKAHVWKGGVAPLILDLGTKWR